MLKKLGYSPLVVCLLSAQLLNFSSQAFAKENGGGVIGGGGGDASEERVNEIRSDILKWIKKGGAKGLELPSDLLYEDYLLDMTNILEVKKVVIGFVEKDDEKDDELKVSVGGTPKTCRGFTSVKDSKQHILCNISRFTNTSESDQYKLIHHEYAGLVNIEKNEGAASDYVLSSQLTGFLTQQTVLKLAVKSDHPGKRILKHDEPLEVIKGQKFIQYFSEYMDSYDRTEVVDVLDLYEDGSIKLYFKNESKTFVLDDKRNIIAVDPNLCIENSKGRIICVNQKIKPNYSSESKECAVTGIFVQATKKWISKKLKRKVSINCGEPASFDLDINELILNN